MVILTTLIGVSFGCLGAVLCLDAGMGPAGALLGYTLTGLLAGATTTLWAGLRTLRTPDPARTGR